MEDGWALLSATAVVSALIALPWLGVEAIGPAIAALGTKAPIEPDNLVLGFSWLRENVSWWPAWGGLLAGGILVAIPTRGPLGLGLGMLAGLAVIPNLWRSYLPAVVVAGVLIWRGLRPATASTAGSESGASALRFGRAPRCARMNESSADVGGLPLFPWGLLGLITVPLATASRCSSTTRSAAWSSSEMRNGMRRLCLL